MPVQRLYVQISSFGFCDFLSCFCIELGREGELLGCGEEESEREGSELDFSDDKRIACGGQSIASFLIMPVQRLYVQFLSFLFSCDFLCCSCIEFERGGGEVLGCGEEESE